MNQRQIPSIPSISAKTAPVDVIRAFDSLRNFFGQLQKEGAVTMQDLIAIGLLGPDGKPAADEEETNDGLIPPKITGLEAFGAFNAIILEWDDPRYLRQAYIEIWRSATNDIDAAQRVGTTNANAYVDVIAASTVSQTFYYWVRIVSTGNVSGPFSDMASASTADDPQYILDLLNGRIKASELHSTLSSRVNLIDAPTTGLWDRASVIGSTVSAVQGAVTTWDNASAAIAVEKNLRAITSGPDWLASSVYYKGNVVQYSSKLYQALYDYPTVGVPPSSNPSHWKEITSSLYGQYSVKIDNNGYVAGYGLANDGVTSSFLVRADIFAVGQPGATGVYPFVVDTSNNRVAMDGAYIVKGTIGTATIGTAVINAAHIIDANVTTIKLAGNAVTIATGAIVTADATITPSTWQIINQVTVNFDIAPSTTWVTFSVGVQGNMTAADDIQYTIRVRVGAYTDGMPVTVRGDYADLITMSYFSNYSFSGSQTYYLEAYIPTGKSATCTGSAITVMGAKR